MVNLQAIIKMFNLFFSISFTFNNSHFELCAKTFAPPTDYRRDRCTQAFIFLENHPKYVDNVYCLFTQNGQNTRIFQSFSILKTRIG